MIFVLGYLEIVCSHLLEHSELEEHRGISWRVFFFFLTTLEVSSHNLKLLQVGCGGEHL